MKKLLLILGFVLGMNGLQAQTLAFPGAEGFGRYTTGGRGGAVIYVTNLNDAGAGSLRAAIQASGARTVVFAVSGTIEIQSDLKISNDNITIAGQTAPGDGICIKAAPVVITSLNKTTYSSPTFQISANNVIIRYIRFRPGDEINNTAGAEKDSIKFENDGIFSRNRSNIIIDHCSVSWGNDEVLSSYDNTNSTIQWCIISESLYASYHPKGNHGYGGIWGGKGATFHHNLLAHHSSRNPRFCGSRYSNLPDQENIEHRNNVIYNWGGNTAYGAEGGSYNIVNNYYKNGPYSSNDDRIIAPNADNGDNSQPAGVWGKFYIDSNFVWGYPSTTADNWTTGVQEVTAAQKLEIKSDNVLFEIPALTNHTAVEAFEYVLAYAGAILPKRDTVDARIIQEAKDGTYTYGYFGRIDSPTDVGGWPTLTSATAPVDTDNDGMPNEWEKVHGLDTANAADRNTISDPNGYTNLEVYLNSLVDSIEYLIRPVNMTLTAENDSVVKVRWDDYSDNETNFVIERKIDGEFQAIKTTDANDTVYYDSIPDYGHYCYRMKAINAKLSSFYTDSVSIDILTTTPNMLAQQEIHLECYPNPFTNNMHITFQLEKSDIANITLYDMTGKRLGTIFHQAVKAGSNELIWNGTMDGKTLDAGLYFITIQLHDNVISKRIIKQ
ncbi:MAG: T9SS type A sorting domain-containing protein [Bacteroidales bacterium]|nr:T9SS type A sorting domain-containing protein [Bacteroidales bacterium]